MKTFIQKIIADPFQHGRWLNTLSYLENEGAKLLAGCQHPTMVPEQMLKHAAEEFRHAHYLKSQIIKVWPTGIESYHVNTLIGSYSAYHYMRRLNIGVSRLLKEHGWTGLPLRGAAYALVSYAIEVRAHDLYPIYQEHLLADRSRVSVRSIIVEEAEHLAEMTSAVAKIPNGEQLSAQACQIETGLWIALIEKQP